MPTRAPGGRVTRGGSPLEAARVAGGGEPGPFEVMCLLVPTATRTPRSDVFSRSDCDPHPSERRVPSVRFSITSRSSLL